jgi:hypothetical protein
VMRKRISAVFGVASILALSAALTQGAEARRPNVLLILADDLGYGELSCQGRQTPCVRLVQTLPRPRWRACHRIDR